jgi:hypothetical protein
MLLGIWNLRKFIYLCFIFSSIDLSNWSVTNHKFNVKQDMLVKEDHPLALNLSFAISLGLLPVTLSLKTVGCGVKNSGLQDGEAGNEENGSKNYISFSTVSLKFYFLLVIVLIVFSPVRSCQLWRLIMTFIKNKLLNYMEHNWPHSKTY